MPLRLVINEKNRYDVIFSELQQTCSERHKIGVATINQKPTKAWSRKTHNPENSNRWSWNPQTVVDVKHNGARAE